MGAEWDRLNDEQARLYLAAGRVVTPEQQKIIDRMTEIAPPGAAGWFDNKTKRRLTSAVGGIRGERN